MSSMICPVSLFSRVVNRDDADAGMFHPVPLQGLNGKHQRNKKTK